MTKTAHELARELLAGRDLPIYCVSYELDGDYVAVERVEVEDDEYLVIIGEFR